MRTALTSEQAAAYSTPSGVYLEFESAPNVDWKVESLEDRRVGIRLLNVRIQKEGNQETQRATVYLPRSKSAHFLNKIEEYRDQNTARAKPKNEPLVACIEDIRGALLEALWTGDIARLPQQDAKWVEVWLSSESQEIIESFRQTLAVIGIPEHQSHPVLKFPELSVLLVRANREQLSKLLHISDNLAEFRLACNPPNIFVDMPNREQAARVTSLQKRTTYDDTGNVSICILDTGINSGHPLLAPVLPESDVQAVRPHWGIDDHDGHGTNMAGIAIYGDLQSVLESPNAIELRHKLESVKILPRGQEVNESEAWGVVTKDGIDMAEKQNPHRRRVVCMAVGSASPLDGGKPTSWSAQIDNLASEAPDNAHRLIVVSAGNADVSQNYRYPTDNLTDEILDPAQSWNALTVGAFTNKIIIEDSKLEGYHPLAPSGGLSPYSTTSLTWASNRWPIKPEILLEGGNLALDPAGNVVNVDDLMLLTTSRDVNSIAPRHFGLFNATSAATAQASHLAAQIYAEYPEAWPETVRGLLVHSAEWTNTMKHQFLTQENRTGYRKLLRTCGYGIPNLNSALHCMRNRLTLVSQEAIQPFKLKDNNGAMNELHSYELPWPHDILLELAETEVKMRVTLSYFVEPSPGEKGRNNRYRYASHGLRFELNDPNETAPQFMSRVNKQVREEEDGNPETSAPSNHWLLGKQRDVGSIHSDIWTGTAAALATSNLLVVRPSIGWWRERKHLGKCTSSTRYSLIVSIETPTTEVDIYTPVRNLIATQIPIEVQITAPTL